MYLDKIPVPGKDLVYIVITDLDDIQGVLAELESAGWRWNVGQKPTKYDPLYGYNREDVTGIVLRCETRLVVDVLQGAVQ